MASRMAGVIDEKVELLKEAEVGRETGARRGRALTGTWRKAVKWALSSSNRWSGMGGPVGMMAMRTHDNSRKDPPTSMACGACTAEQATTTNKQAGGTSIILFCVGRSRWLLLEEDAG